MDAGGRAMQEQLVVTTKQRNFCLVTDTIFLAKNRSLN
ncbi:hypothetical protein PARC_a2214 [Pseudoalteromonas arctica A 37-1-2]|uniref:Uncharacterized protein n=1 Tax=Pseudoalteromonas arctica A 37-1-2 TaxID=1117313 RepID=A0A290S4Y3_9GAMM|nr:hypothetical protein PARC_a2214 [Pseudoalteromonas arctica A 37-1-2]